MELYEKINKELNYNYEDNLQIDFKYILINEKIPEYLLDEIINLLKNENYFSENYFSMIIFSISKYQKLSEAFIDRNKDKLSWSIICEYQILSEDFIRAHSGYVYWDLISTHQHLSEDFIKEFSSKVSWQLISIHQKLSGDFMREMINHLNFDYICMYQKLSESFIEEFSDKFNWYLVCMYQKLSSNFIIKHADNVNWYNIVLFQKISETIKKNYANIIPKHLYHETYINVSPKDKEKYLRSWGLYECYDDYFIGYKAIRGDRYSLYNFQYKYEKGGVYESWCDCTSEENSFGLNVGTKEEAKKYLGSQNGFIVRCKVRYEDIGCIVHDGNKVRCFRIEILD